MNDKIKNLGLEIAKELEKEFHPYTKVEITVDGVKIVEDLCFEPIGADSKKTDTDTTNKCVVCSEKADLELENGNFICENCAQIMGELAED
ncbi:hypothetical protein AFU33_13635 [Listeria monocytogenes]|nr:hypothetical protein [Listeria monocytogenes]EAF0657345.1 hypothetical protein [Listeria monocytogenes]